MSATVWYVARAGGIVAFLLLSSSVALGLLMAARKRLRWPRFAVEALHRYLSILTAAFIVLHGGALLLDRVVPFSLVQLLVPFTSSYRPFAVSLGVLSAELLAAIGITNALRSRLPHRLWRRVHYLTLLVWVGSAAHVLLVGTDRRDGWLLAVVGLAVATVALCGLVRVGRGFGPAAAAAGLAASAAAVLALAFTPQPQPASAATAAVPARFSSPLSARVVEGRSQPLVSVVGQAGSAELRVDLLVSGGAVEQSSLQLRFGSATCAGTISSLDETGAAGTCRAGGVNHPVRITWTVTGETVTGQLSVGNPARTPSTA